MCWDEETDASMGYEETLTYWLVHLLTYYAATLTSEEETAKILIQYGANPSRCITLDLMVGAHHHNIQTTAMIMMLESEDVVDDKWRFSDNFIIEVHAVEELVYCFFCNTLGSLRMTH